MLPIHDLVGDEKELVLLLRDGDQRAFEKLYTSYSPVIAAHLVKLLKSEDLAFEVTQDTFIALWEKRGNIDPTQSIKSYLYKIATNKTYKVFRKATYDKGYRAYLLPIIEEGYNNIEAYIGNKENKEILNSILSNMPEKQREVYLLHKVEGYSYKEISEKLGVSLGTVNTHIHRAKQYIKSHIIDRPEFIPVILGTLLSTIS